MGLRGSAALALLPFALPAPIGWALAEGAQLYAERHRCGVGPCIVDGVDKAPLLHALKGFALWGSLLFNPLAVPAWIALAALARSAVVARFRRR